MIRSVLLTEYNNFILSDVNKQVNIISGKETKLPWKKNYSLPIISKIMFY